MLEPILSSLPSQLQLLLQPLLLLPIHTDLSQPDNQLSAPRPLLCAQGTMDPMPSLSTNLLKAWPCRGFVRPSETKNSPSRCVAVHDLVSRIPSRSLEALSLK